MKTRVSVLNAMRRLGVALSGGCLHTLKSITLTDKNLRYVKMESFKKQIKITYLVRKIFKVLGLLYNYWIKKNIILCSFFTYVDCISSFKKTRDLTKLVDLDTECVQ